MRPGSWALIRAPAPPGLQVWAPGADWGTHPLGHFGSGAQAAGALIRAHAHQEFQLWAPNPLI